MSFHVVGLAGDHTSSPQEFVKEFIKTNWALTGDLLTAKVLFSTGWYSSQNQYQVHVRHDIAKDVKKITIGKRPMYQFPDMVTVHCFAQEQTDNIEAPNLDKMNREILRIIGSDATALETTQGVCDLYIGGTPRIMPLEDDLATIFHSVINIGLIYRKVYS